MPEHDEFHGHGGSYIRDPETGKRKLVERTKDEVGAERPDEKPKAADKE